MDRMDKAGSKHGTTQGRLEVRMARDIGSGGSPVSRIVIGALLGICLLISGCSASIGTTSAPSPTAPPFAATLQPKLVTEMQRLNVPGAIVYVHDPAKGTWTTTLGTGSLTTHAPLTVADHMRVGSITKTFTGTVILQLVDEGKLRLDDPVAKYQPQVPNGAQITIRQLLNMTSGLFSYSEDAGLGQALLDQPQKPWTPQELVAIAFKHPPNFAPGTNFHYSNTNTILLGMIAEQITGKSLAEEFQSRIFTPLSMRATSFPAKDVVTIPNSHPRGYASKPSDSCPPTPIPGSEAISGTPAATSLLCDVTEMNPSWGWAAGAAISTLHDLQIWAKALATGSLLSAQTQKQRLTWVQPSPTAKYGLAIFDVEGFLGHNGSLPGFQSFMGYMPSKDATIIVLTNLDKSSTCTPSTTAPGQPPTCPETADSLARVIIGDLFS
jgi:D-alanyl-D-alanine carboxypeptidase